MAHVKSASAKPTVSLQMIVKDEFDIVAHDVINPAIPYFTQVNVTVSDKTTANKLKKYYVDYPTVNIHYREWTNDFGAARNANLELCTTDYFFWLDSDDRFDFAAIPQLVEIADQNNIDSIFLPYNYAQDEQGNCVTRHWRERLIRTGRGFSWRGAIHETCISEENIVSHKVDCEVKHNNTPEHARASMARNHEILLGLCEGKDISQIDPRYLHYLGMSLFTQGDYEGCIDTLSTYLGVGGSLEDSYRSMTLISEAAYHLGDHAQAMEFAMKCAAMKPDYPMAYWLLAQYEADQKNWEEALEWIKVSESKPDPNTLSVYDPSARERAILIAAQCYFMLNQYAQAHAQLKRLPNNPSAKELLPEFAAEAATEKFCNLLPSLRSFFKNDYVLWFSLDDELKYDTRLRPLRFSATFPTTWGDKSIAIFCGQGYEEWGPHTGDKGMGGSEEAVVYLAPELVKLGYKVTVYGEVPEEMTVDGVRWLPWKQIDVRDNFNVFVSWRAPQFLEKINAKVKLADIHDVLPEKLIKDYPDVTYLFKTNYHKDLYGPVKSAVIGNGIKKDQFND